jgi:transposase-like protein
VPYQSQLLSFRRGHTDVLDGLAGKMYARGLSTRDIEDTFRDVTGASLVSARGVSVVTASVPRWLIDVRRFAGPPTLTLKTGLPES